MLKCNKGEGTAELEEALATVLDIIKSVNDSMHQIAITGFEVGGVSSYSAVCGDSVLCGPPVAAHSLDIHPLNVDWAGWWS